MISRPQFKKHYEVRSEPEGIVLQFQNDRAVLEGPLYVLLAPFLDGRYTADEIVEKLEGRANVLDVIYGLASLQNDGYVVEAEAGEWSGSGVFKNRSQQVARQEFRIADGGYRVVSPEVTYEKYRHHIDPVAGLIASVQPAGPHDDGDPVQVYVAKHNFTVKSLPISSRIRRNASAGKGMTWQQARTGALCEALERFSGLYRGHEGKLRASYRDCSDVAIHPYACMHFSADQYRNRQEWNGSEADYNWIPEEFRDDEPVEWTDAWSLSEERVRYLPTAYCYYAYPHAAGHDFCRADSNGNAAGNTLEEAILQGFLELVERDSVALWWYNRARRPAADMKSFGEPYFTALEERYRALGREIWALDITSDLKIPAFAAVSPATLPGKEDLMLGFGAHLDPAIALSRALTELNQFLPAILTGVYRPQLTSVLVGDDSFCRPDSKVGLKRFESFPHRSVKGLSEAVAVCVDLARENGVDVLVTDQTRPDVGLNAVKVVVPGLRQFWARFGPGRLYEVPVKLGWQPLSLTEAQLNPAHLLM
jgi:thiazole/oxazole-forming peptide maturase SagD family component